jgi:hypothetical protein
MASANMRESRMTDEDPAPNERSDDVACACSSASGVRVLPLKLTGAAVAVLPLLPLLLLLLLLLNNATVNRQVHPQDTPGWARAATPRTLLLTCESCLPNMSIVSEHDHLRQRERRQCCSEVELFDLWRKMWAVTTHLLD